jgi:hypothetical protein
MTTDGMNGPYQMLRYELMTFIGPVDVGNDPAC